MRSPVRQVDQINLGGAAVRGSLQSLRDGAPQPPRRGGAASAAVIRVVSTSSPNKQCQLILCNITVHVLNLSDDETQTSVAVLTGDPRGRRGVLVYAHVPCLFGDALGSTACVGRTRLRDGLVRMRAEGHGAAVYHRDPSGGLGSCCCTTGADDYAPLSEGALEALVRAVRSLDLRAIRLIGTAADGRHAARAGVPIGELITLARA
jgi:hypothetical protein